MPARIRIPERIPQGVAVAVERLRIRRIGDNRIRLKPAIKITVVVPRNIVVEPGDVSRRYQGSFRLSDEASLRKRHCWSISFSSRIS